MSKTFKTRLFMTAFALFLLAAPVSPRAQDNRMVIDKSRDAIITGFVQDVYYNTFTIQNDQNPAGPPITVTLQNLDLPNYNNIDTLINDGMRVTVYGHLVNGNTIQANRIVRQGWGG